MLIPIILFGGTGTRLWPVSREGHSKPFMNLADGRSLLLKTYLRAANGVQAGNVSFFQCCPSRYAGVVDLLAYGVYGMSNKFNECFQSLSVADTVTDLTKTV